MKNKLISIITLLICLTFAMPTVAAKFPAMAWTVVKEIAIDTAIDAVQKLFTKEVKPEEVAALQQRVSQLDTQIVDAKKLGNYPSESEYNNIKQLVTSLNQMTNTMTNRLASVEARVTQLETELALVRQVLLNIPRGDQELLKGEKSAALDFKINYVYRSGGKGNYKSLTNGGVLHSGDYYKIIFTPVENCYISIFQVDSANKLYRLFPMTGFGGVVVNNFNPVEAGKTYYIPGKNQSFELDDQIGIETIYFVASRHNDIVLEKQYQALQLREQQNEIAQAQQAQVQLIQTLRESKGVKAIQDDIIAVKTSWQEQGENFSVSQKSLEDLCNGCVNILTFQHQ